VRPADLTEVGADLPALVAELADALGSGGRRDALTPPRFMTEWRDPYSVFGAMPSVSRAHGVFVTKVAALVEKPGKPTINAVVVVFSTTTGELLATLDGAALTNVKCAAVTALVTDRCALREARTLGVVGTGTLAWQQVLGVGAVRDLAAVTVFGRDAERARRFAARVRALLGDGVDVRVARELGDAVERQDVVCTATTSSEPLLTGLAVEAPAHVNCMGSHTPESREVGRELLAASTLVVEDRATAVAEAGEVHRDALELEDVLAAGDSLRTERTIFSSTGHAFLDLVTAAHVVNGRARG
jgi:ornithine cyclodeaminase/alanine dehydrogenase-like protein (mu-crystallin family)